MILIIIGIFGLIFLLFTVAWGGSYEVGAIGSGIFLIFYLLIVLTPLKKIIIRIAHKREPSHDHLFNSLLIAISFCYVAIRIAVKIGILFYILCRLLLSLCIFIVTQRLDISYVTYVYSEHPVKIASILSKPFHAIINGLVKIIVDDNYIEQLHELHMEETGITLFFGAHTYNYDYLVTQAKYGSRDAMVMLGDAFFTGKHGIQIDISTGVYYYQMAAKVGEPNAQYICGCYFMNNRQVGEAIKYHNFAAAQGHSQAQYELGHYYFFEVNDINTSIYYLCHSSLHGNINAQTLLNEIVQRGIPKAYELIQEMYAQISNM